MPSDHMSEKKATKSSQVGAPPPEPEHLPCPRCDSTNTKFCYYNNYNSSQPRHFCKSCRRYWTHGGTLRDIPVGGGSRKNAKRSRTTIVTSNNTASTGLDSVSSVYHDFHHLPAPSSQLLIPFAADHCGAVPFVTDAKPMCGSFTSLLNTQGTGLLSLGGFGHGIGSGLEDVGVGLGRAFWPFPGAVEGGLTSGSVGMVSNTWQLESGENGFVSGGDCFNLPDLAISTPGNGMKW